MTQIMTSAFCLLAFCGFPTSAVFRSRGGVDNVDKAPNWLEAIAAGAKQRISVGSASVGSSNGELSVLSIDAQRAEADQEAPTAGTAIYDKKSRLGKTGKSPRWLRNRFPSMAASQPSPSPPLAADDGPPPLDVDEPPSAGDAEPADPRGDVEPADFSLTGEFFQSLSSAQSSSSAHFDEKKVVWITAYPRSGSTSILAMISPPEREEWRTFTAFEPCVGRGSPWKTLTKEGCEREVKRVTRCDYTGVEHIGAKESVNSLTLYDADAPHTPSLSGAQTAAACAAADVVALKTIAYAHDLTEVLPLLEQDERIQILDVVRDPRGIYASWLSTEPFRGLVTGQHAPYWRRHDKGWFTNLTGICDHFQKNLHTPHPRVRRILFENLIRDPTTVAKMNYEWLGLPFDEAAESWIRANFDGHCSKESTFGTCRGNSSASLLRWKEVLPQKEQEAFAAHPACQEIADFYGYPL